MRTFDYTKLAERTWDTETISYLTQIHERKGREDLYVRQKTVELNRLLEIARIQSTESSNRIEGIVTTGTRMRQLVEERTTPRNRDESEIMGYRDVLRTIHESYDMIPLRPSYILQLHRDLLKPAGLSHAGRFKDVQNYINETRADGTVVTRFTPTPPYETPDAVEAVCNAYTWAAASEQVDPLLLIPAFLCDFLCIHPFNDGNGRITRLLTLLLLYQNGYEVGRYISIEKKIEESKDAYYDALECSSYGWQEERNDPTPFIKYMLQVILACYIDLEERIGLVGGENSKRTAYDVVSAYVEGKIGKFTSADVMAACPGAGRSSVLAALKKMANEHRILQMGSGRSTFYIKSDAMREQGSEEYCLTK